MPSFDIWYQPVPAWQYRINWKFNIHVAQSFTTLLLYLVRKIVGLHKKQVFPRDSILALFVIDVKIANIQHFYTVVYTPLKATIMTMVLQKNFVSKMPLKPLNEHNKRTNHDALITLAWPISFSFNYWRSDVEGKIPSYYFMHAS